MKMRSLIIFLILSVAGNLSSNEPDYSSTDFRYVKNEAFGFGERLNYKVGYKFITAGEGSFVIGKNPVIVNGRKAYDIRFYVKSLESLEWIYKVKDWYRSVVDVGAIFPWEFEQHIRQGKYKRDFHAKFDQKENTAFVKDTSYSTVPNVMDIVSAMYYVRTWDLTKMKRDSIVYLNNFYKDSTYTLGVKMLGKQTIEVEAGKFQCYVVEPLVQEGGLFKNEANIVVWLTADDRKIPVKVATKIVIGYVGAELVSYSGLRGPVNAKIKN